MTTKKRLTITFVDEKDYEIIEKLKKHINTKQISKVISYCLKYTFYNDLEMNRDITTTNHDNG